MTILPIVLAPNPILRKKCARVATFDTALQTLIEDMFETMYDAPGIGLAAPQVGKDLQLLVMDAQQYHDGTAIPDEELEKNPALSRIALINPKIIQALEECGASEEGCLSIPGYEISVTRAHSVLVQYQDMHGKLHRTTFCGLLARCVQHEIDHLHGKLIIDYVSQLRRNRILRSLRETKQATE